MKKEDVGLSRRGDPQRSEEAHSKNESGKLRDNSFGVAAVILAIIGINTPFAGFIPGLIGLIFALKQKKVSKNAWSTWGTILSVISILLSIIALVYYVVILKNAGVTQYG